MTALRLSGATLLLTVLLAVVAASGGAAGCSTGTAYTWECQGPDGAYIGSAVSSDCTCPCLPQGCCIPALVPLGCGTGTMGVCQSADGGADGGEGGPIPSCAGQCLPNPPMGWSPPGLLWSGSPLDPPVVCPPNAPAIGYQGHADPTTTLACDTCSCTQPAGTCGLPATLTANTASCNEGGGTASPFDPPAAWDGGCTTYDAVDTSVGSVTVAPLALNESACTTVSAPPASMHDPDWMTAALSCTASAGGTCASPGETCAPAAPKGFEQCTFLLDEDMDCPSFSAYTVKHVFYTSAIDTRACSECACGPASGSCSTTLSIYANSTCSGGALGAVTVTSQTSACVTAPGVAVLSKASGPATYTPGTCQPSGGVASGTVTPVGPSTFCCLP